MILIMSGQYFMALRTKAWLLSYSGATALLLTIALTEISVIINPLHTFSESNMLLVVVLAVLS